MDDQRWSCYTREEIRAKGDTLDLGLIADESLSAYENLPDPIESAEEAIGKLEQAIALLNEVVHELKAAEGGTQVSRKKEKGKDAGGVAGGGPGAEEEQPYEVPENWVWVRLG